MRAGVCATALLVLAAGCRTARVSAAPPPLEVASLALDFPVPDQGTLTFSVDVPANEQVTGVSWALAVRGFRFASGFDARPTVAATERPNVARLTVSTRLVYRHHGWRDGATFLDAEVDGAIVVRDGARELRFAGRKEVLSRGAPVFEAPGD